MRHGVHVAQFAVLDAEEVSVWRAAASVCVSSAESAERDDSTDRRVHNEAAVCDIHTARHANIATVIGVPSARVHAAFGAVAGIAPRHKVLLLLEKRIEVSVGGGDKSVARIALVIELLRWISAVKGTLI